MGKISDAVNYALAQQGKPYHAYGNRFGPDYFDCSGLMNACLNHTGTPCSATNTVGFWSWGRDTGKLISVDEAKHTYGAMLIKGRWYGYGPLGHIGISLGDGRSMEAVGSRLGCRIMDVNATRWQDGLIVPGAEYGPITPPTPPQPAFVLEPSMIVQQYHYDAHGVGKRIEDKWPATDPLGRAGKWHLPTIGPSTDGKALILKDGASFEGAGKAGKDDIFVPPEIGQHGGRIIDVAKFTPQDGSPQLLIVKFADNHQSVYRLT